MRLRKVTDRVYANWDGETGGNVGIIELSENTIVIDAQYPGSARKFRDAIPKVSSKLLSHLLLTHVHGDHVAFQNYRSVGHCRRLSRSSLYSALTGVRRAPESRYSGTGSRAQPLSRRGILTELR